MTITATTTRRPNVHEMVVVHRAFRRELRLLPDIVRGVAAGDVDRAVEVSDHLRLMIAGLHSHHTGEDEVLWPLLHERAAPSTGLVDTMEEQHGRVDSHLRAITPMVATWRVTASPATRDRLAGAVESLGTELTDHLDLEEREILPLVSHHVTAAEWDSIGEHGRQMMSLRQMPLLFGSVLEDADAAERAMLLAPLPRPVRLYLRTLGARRYQQYVARIRRA